MLKKIFANVLLSSIICFQFLFVGVQFCIVYAEELPSPVPETPYLIISAVQITGGTGHTQEDFIELYNPTSQPFDLNGHRLVKRTSASATDALIKSWTEPTIVAGHHFYLWANSSFSALPVIADSASTATLADNNGIALRLGDNDSGAILDSLAWGSTANGFTPVSDVNPGANESLVRTNFFEEQPVFTISPSTPRNSEVNQEPTLDDIENDDDEEPDELPSDDSEPEEPEPVEIEITELYPNPSGSDSGYEQIELYNAGLGLVILTGYKLDDITASDSLSSNVYTLPELEISPGSFLAVTIPAGKFSMNNTGGDAITLFNPSGEAIATATYSVSTPEGKSFSLFDNEWQWATPTLGEENGSAPQDSEDEDAKDEKGEDAPNYGDYDNAGLIINEIYASPTSPDTEFIELYNSGEETAQLAVVNLWVGERHKTLPEHELKPGDYYIIEQTALPVQLRNSGQIIKFIEGSELLDKVTYPAVLAGNSYARFEDGFLLTTRVTKDATNILELPEEVKKVATVAAAKTTTAKTAKATTKATTKTTAKKSTTGKTASNSNTNKAPVKNSVATGLNLNSEDSNTALSSDKPAENNKDSMGKIIAMGAAAVTAGMVALYKLVFSARVE